MRRDRVVPMLLVLCALALMAVWYPVYPLSQTQSTGVLSTPRSWATPFAFNGGFAAFWEDSRTSPSMPSAWGTRVSPAGVTLDPAGIQISTPPWSGTDPVGNCISATQCLLAWVGGPDGVTVRTFDGTTGLPGASTAVTNEGRGYGTPTIGNDGVRYLLLYSDFGGVEGRFVTTSLGVGVETNLMTRAFAIASVAWNGSTYLVVAVDRSNNTVWARAFDGNLAPRTAQTQIGTTNDGWTPIGLTSTPTGFVAGWRGTNNNINMRVFTSTGATSGGVINPIAGSNNREGAALAWDGAFIVVTWIDTQFTIHGIRFATLPGSPAEAEWTLVPTQPIKLENLRMSAFTGNTALMTWNTPNFRDPEEMNAAIVTSNAALTASSPGVITQTAADAHTLPRVAQLGTGYVVSWSSRLKGVNVSQALARVIDAQGQPQGPQYALSPTSTLFPGADVASDGTNTFAMWSSGDTPRVTLLTAVGAPTVTRSMGTGFFWTSQPRLAMRAGTTAAGMWTGEDVGGYGAWLHLIDTAGVPIGANAVKFFSSATQLLQPAFTASSTQYLAVWLDGREVRGTRISTGATALDPTGLQLASNNDAYHVSTASDGTNFMVVWNHSEPGDVRAQRVLANGSLSPAVPFLVSNPSADIGDIVQDPSEPEVVFDGTDYVVTWPERVADGGGLDIHARRLFLDGGMGPIEFIAGGTAAQWAPTLGTGAPGAYAAAWLEFNTADGVSRVHVSAFEQNVTLIDAGVPDAGVPDAGVPDAGIDAGLPDAGALDAAVDAGAPDAGADAGGIDGGEPDASVDAGPTVDAGSSDSGVDGGIDAGSSSDGGDDAGNDAGIDGGTIDGGSRDPVYTVGCGCHSGTGGWPLLALVVMLRRRRVH